MQTIVSVQRNAMKISRSGVLTALGAILLLSSAALETVNINTDRKGKEKSEHIVSEIKEFLIDKPDNNPISDAADNNEGSVSEDFVIVDGEKYLGILTIPEIGIELPVSHDYSYEQMSESLCRYSGSLEDKDMIICGHNYRSFLQELDQVDEGDSIIFTDFRGVNYEYIVNEIQLIGGYELSKLLKGGEDWDMSLFTCNYSGYSRYVIRCKLVKW